VAGGLASGVDFVTNLFPSLTVQNAASFVATSVAPGEIVALRGYGIGPVTGISAASPVAQLVGVQVSFGGYPAPLFYALANQINAQVPWELAGQTSTTVQITYPGVASTVTPVVLTPSLPGIFYINNSDGSRNSPSNPAAPGDFIAIYGTGGGTLNPTGITGQFWGTQLSTLMLPVSAAVGGEDAIVLYAGSAPTRESGFFQSNVLLPPDLQASSVLSLTIGDATSVAVPVSIGA
jgi:uncharacterized protein (TIGR03437 family)